MGEHNKKQHEPILYSDDRVERVMQCISDLPPEALIDNVKCHLKFFYDANKYEEGSVWKWTIQYVDENEKPYLESGGADESWAVRNMMIQIRNSLKFRSLDGNFYMLAEFLFSEQKKLKSYTLVDRLYKLTEHKDKSHWRVCPFCDSHLIESDYYNDLHPEALAGSAGYHNKCKECGYTWTDKLIQS